MKSRFFRAVVCLLVICALIVNISPIQARAVVPEASAVGMGVLIFLLLGFVGVVLHPDTAYDFVASANSFTTYLADWGSKNDKSEIVDVWIEGVQIDLTGGGGNSPLHIPPEIQLAIAQWIYEFLGGDTEILGASEVAPEGYMYYNGYLFPELPSDAYTWKALMRNDDGSIYLSSWSEIPKHTSNGYIFTADSTMTQYLANHRVIDGEWSRTYNTSSISSFSCGTVQRFTTYCIWANFDIKNVNDPLQYIFKGGSSSKYLSESLVPNVLIGDVAPGIQEGTHTAEDIELPEYVDTDSSIKYQGLVGTEAVQKMLDDLAHNELTFDEYKAIVGSGISGDTGDLGGDSGDGSDETQPVVPPNTDITDGLQGVQDGIQSLPQRIASAIANLFIPSGDLASYAIDLTSFFPFCIPWDIYAFLELFLAEPEAPHMEFDINFPYMREPWHVVIDLSDFDGVALLARRLQLALFIVGLAVFTRQRYLVG